MPSDRMMQAIGRLEQALSRVEQLCTEQAAALHPPSDALPIDREKAAQALQALDELLDQMRGSAHG